MARFTVSITFGDDGSSAWSILDGARVVDRGGPYPDDPKGDGAARAGRAIARRFALSAGFDDEEMETEIAVRGQRP